MYFYFRQDWTHHHHGHFDPPVGRGTLPHLHQSLCQTAGESTNLGLGPCLDSVIFLYIYFKLYRYIIFFTIFKKFVEESLQRPKIRSLRNKKALLLECLETFFFFFWVESGSSFKRSADTVKKKNWTRILCGLKKSCFNKIYH